MSEMKKFTFDFFQCETTTSQPALPKISTSEILRKLKHKFDVEGDDTVRSFNGTILELRKIDETDYGFRGVIGKYRTAFLPHAAVPGGGERELDLHKDEHLIEKAYFHYYSDHALLICQRNRYALGHSLFGQYLSSSGYTTVLNPIIEPADLQKLLRNEVNVRAVNVSIARPTNPDLFIESEHDFNNSLIQSLNSSKAAVIKLEMRGDGRSDDPERRYLASNIKSAFLELRKRFNVKSARILLEENGITHPIDLVADRLEFQIEIKMSGRYPLDFDMWKALEDARKSKEVEIQKYFGTLNGEWLV
jgi:hypothetical protein